MSITFYRFSIKNIHNTIKIKHNYSAGPCTATNIRIDLATHQAIEQRLAEGLRPPWGSPLGGEVYIHEGGTASDWTQGCIALESRDMDVLFPRWGDVRQVEILP